MTDTEKDALFFRHKKGRYGPGGKWENATRPMEGGTAAAGYIPKATGTASRPQASAFCSHNGAEPVKAEPITEPEADTMPYAPPRMERIPAETAPDELEQVQGFPEMEPETEAEPARAYFYKMDERSGIIR